MSKRKEIMLLKDIEECRSILEMIDNALHPPSAIDNVQGKLHQLLSFLNNKGTVEFAIEGIAKLLKITAPKCILGAVEISMYFAAIIRLLPVRQLNLEILIQIRAVALLKDLNLITQLFKIYPSTKFNKEHIQEMIIILAEECELSRPLLSSLINVRPFPTSLFSRVFQYIDLKKLPDDLYVIIAVQCANMMARGDIRLVRARNRLEFVRALIPKFRDEISLLYANDRDKAVRKEIACDCRSPDIFYRLLNDPEEDVRASLLYNFAWDDAVEWKIATRLLDKSKMIRDTMFGLFQVGYKMHAKSSIFKQASCKLIENSNDKSSEETVVEIKGRETFMEFIYTMFKGCLTMFYNEYLAILNELPFTIKFLYESREKEGVSIFLKSRTLTNLDEISDEYHPFCLGYMQCTNLTDTQIGNYISNDIFEILPYVTSALKYNDLLLEKVRTVKDIFILEQIVTLLRPYLPAKCPNQSQSISSLPHSDTVIDGSNVIAGTADDSTYLSEQSDLLFLNAHMECNSEYIEGQFIDLNNLVDKQGRYELIFSKLYFLVHQRPADYRLRVALKSINIPQEELILLLLHLNDDEFLCNFVDGVLLCNVRGSLLNRIMNSKTKTGYLLYFLLSGRITIKKPGFFISTLRLASCSRNKEAIRKIFRNYICAIPNQVFDIFYTICCELKKYKSKNSISEIPPETMDGYGDNLLGVPVNNENRSNLASNDQVKGLLLNKNDEMLYWVCDYVRRLKNGNLVEIDIDFTKFGFIKLTENENEMIRHNQISYN